jgi:hypothetical protein
MRPRHVYKYMLNNLVSHIDHVLWITKIKLELMTYKIMFATQGYTYECLKRIGRWMLRLIVMSHHISLEVHTWSVFISGLREQQTTYRLMVICRVSLPSGHNILKPSWRTNRWGRRANWREAAAPHRCWRAGSGAARWTWAGGAKAAFRARLVRAQLQPGTRIRQPVGEAARAPSAARNRAPASLRPLLSRRARDVSGNTSPFLAMWPSRGTDGDHRRVPCRGDRPEAMMGDRTSLTVLGD